MKKTNCYKLLIGIMFLIIITSTAMAAPEILTQIWLISTTLEDTLTPGNPMACVLIDTSAFNGSWEYIATIAATGNVIFAGNYGKISTSFPFVLNRLDGTTTGLGYQGKGRLATVGEYPNAFSGNIVINSIKVADDGVIYGCNQVTDATDTGNPFRIYRWQNENSINYSAYSGNFSGIYGGNNRNEFGDSMGVTGSGVNTKIFVGGQYNDDIVVFTTSDGMNFTLTTHIPTTTSVAPPWSPGAGGGVMCATDICPDPCGNGDLWVNGGVSGSKTRKLHQQVSGDWIAVDTVTQIATKELGATIQTFANGSTYLFTVYSAYNQDHLGRVYNITNGGKFANVDWESPIIGNSASQISMWGADASPQYNTACFWTQLSGLGLFNLPTSFSVPIELSEFTTD